MKIVLWGTGPYCNDKIDYMDKENIVAIVERYHKNYKGFTTIRPIDLLEIEFDKIVIMSTHFIEIIKDIIALGVPGSKISLGISVKPWSLNDLEYINKDISISVNNDGVVLFKNEADSSSVSVSCYDDLKKVKRLVCDEGNTDIIKKLSCLPVGKKYGNDRGGSIVRYYIGKFLSANSHCIRGNCLEIGDRRYTDLYNKNVEKSKSLIYGESIDNEYEISGDLQTGEGLLLSEYDTIIATQVLNFVKDIDNIAFHLIKSLKPGGTLLLTVSGITHIARHDMDRYGQYWAFTEKSIRNMFMSGDTECELFIYGNFKTTCAFLAGLSYTEINKNDLDYVDEDYPLVIAAKVTRKNIV